MLITSKHLQGACQEQIDLFNETFPVGVEFNKTNWDFSLAVGLQVIWMERFLDESVKEKYKAAEISASKTYFKAEISAYKIYQEATESALKILYDEVAAPAWKIFEEAIVPARKTYKEAIASALFNALEQQFNGVK